jgi:hypothetical protein
MVTRNQHDSSSSGWWDDLPPAVKKRVQRPISDLTSPHEDTPNELGQYRPRVVYDLSRLAMLFFAVAVANLIFLLVALSFLSGH